MRAALLLAALSFALPARAAAPPLRLALIEDIPIGVTTPLVPVLERVLREAGSQAELLGVDFVACSYTGPDNICRMPASLGAPHVDAGSDAAALESDVGGVAFVYPPEPDLVEALVKAAADPESSFYGAIQLAEHDADADVHDSKGTTILTFTAALEHRSTRRWREGAAGYYRVRWKGHDAAVLIPGREYGTLGRLAAAADEVPRPWLGVARGGTAGSSLSDAPPRTTLESLERIGLRWSAVGASEIEHWSDVDAYRRERPGGIRFLSANIVYSSSPKSGPFPPYEIVDASGTRVALVGLTPMSAAPLLPRAGLNQLTIRDLGVSLSPLMERLRREADVVVVLASPESAKALQGSNDFLGVDLLLGDAYSSYTSVPPPSTTLSQKGRPAYAKTLPTLYSYRPALNVYEIDRRPDGDVFDWTVTSRARLLDDSVLAAEGYPTPTMSMFTAPTSTEPAVMPPARSLYPAGERSWPYYTSREFWTLSSGMLAEKVRAEAGLLPVERLPGDVPGAVRESAIRYWLGPAEPAVLASVPGWRLKALAAEAAEQERRENADLPSEGKLRFAVSGVDAGGRVRGAPLDPAGSYRVATTRTAAETLGLPGPYDVPKGTPTVSGAVLDELKERSPRSSAADWRAWISGGPLSEPGLWRVNFRDVGLNLRQTKVVRGNEFDAVPNSRIQGSDELLIGGVFKTDVEYLKREFKWTNTAEAEYAKSRIRPRNAPETTNLAANRLMLLTLGTRRAGSIKQEWLARAWGPSVGLQYDGEWEASPGLKRKQAYSLFPGVEFFDGTFVRSLTLSGIVKRDLGREPPNTQTGVRMRTVYMREIGPVKALLQGELWNNYFFLTHKDADGDLRDEGGFNAKLRVPIRAYLSVAPFVDFYWFQLKTRPNWGYTTTVGVSIGFSRLWKPQYEAF